MFIFILEEILRQISFELLFLFIFILIYYQNDKNDKNKRKLYWREL